MKLIRFLFRIVFSVFLLCLIAFGVLALYLPFAHFGSSSGSAYTPRQFDFIQEALYHVGTKEGSDKHKSIIDAYNAHEPLAQGYEVKYDDNWCATFVSFVAIQEHLTDIIPTECSCERQIGLWKQMDRWEENDTYLPLPGDIIYYDWDVRTLGESKGWSDHVGIVVGTHGPFIKVIEGNKDDAIGYRYIFRWDPRIRGYGLPEFA